MGRFFSERRIRTRLEGDQKAVSVRPARGNSGDRNECRWRDDVWLHGRARTGQSDAGGLCRVLQPAFPACHMVIECTDGSVGRGGRTEYGRGKSRSSGFSSADSGRFRIERFGACWLGVLFSATTVACHIRDDRSGCCRYWRRVVESVERFGIVYLNGSRIHRRPAGYGRYKKPALHFHNFSGAAAGWHLLCSSRVRHSQADSYLARRSRRAFYAGSTELFKGTYSALTLDQGRYRTHRGVGSQNLVLITFALVRVVFLITISVIVIITVLFLILAP